MLDMSSTVTLLFENASRRKDSTLTDIVMGSVPCTDSVDILASISTNRFASEFC